jgi:hypothetical protein
VLSLVALLECGFVLLCLFMTKVTVTVTVTVTVVVPLSPGPQ